MNIEEVREYCLSLPDSTEDLFDTDWLTFRVGGKWFVLCYLEASQPQIAVKLPPEMNNALRDSYKGIKPAYHMNKRHWSDIQIENGFTNEQICQWIRTSYELVKAKLPRNKRT